MSGTDIPRAGTTLLCGAYHCHSVYYYPFAMSCQRMEISLCCAVPCTVVAYGATRLLLCDSLDVPPTKLERCTTVSSLGYCGQSQVLCTEILGRRLQGQKKGRACNGDDRFA
eukprot:1129764-Rhodomonas_salina.1